MVRCAALMLTYLGAVCCAGLVTANEPEYRLNERSVFRFATVDEARPVMIERDAFIEELSRFDLECRLQTNQPVSVDMLLEYIPSQLLEWTAEERERLGPLLERVQQRLADWPLPFPETILLIKTTGKEDAGAAYCRGNAVVLPQPAVEQVTESVMLHELFHILSRHNPELRKKLYALVGFTIDADVTLPESLRPLKLTNPDAPKVNCFIQLMHNGEQITATPLLTASAEHFDPQPGRTLFDYLRFHLLVVEREGDRWRAKLDERQQPILLEPGATPSYFEQIGRNTRYIIHPEEVLADNFVLLVRGERDVPSPRILVAMGEVLRPEE